MTIIHTTCSWCESRRTHFWWDEEACGPPPDKGDEDFPSVLCGFCEEQMASEFRAWGGDIKNNLKARGWKP